MIGGGKMIFGKIMAMSFIETFWWCKKGREADQNVTEIWKPEFLLLNKKSLRPAQNLLLS